MATENFELRFAAWKAKVLERMTLSEMKIKDGTELTDEDWSFQEILCRVWFSGMYPIYAARLKGADELAVEQGLFADVTSGIVSGTPFESTVSNQNN